MPSGSPGSGRGKCPPRVPDRPARERVSLARQYRRSAWLMRESRAERSASRLGFQRAAVAGLRSCRARRQSLGRSSLGAADAQPSTTTEITVPRTIKILRGRLARFLCVDGATRTSGRGLVGRTATPTTRRARLAGAEMRPGPRASFPLARAEIDAGDATGGTALRLGRPRSSGRALHAQSARPIVRLPDASQAETPGHRLRGSATAPTPSETVAPAGKLRPGCEHRRETRRVPPAPPG